MSKVNSWSKQNDCFLFLIPSVNVTLSQSHLHSKGVSMKNDKALNLSGSSSHLPSSCSSNADAAADDWYLYHRWRDLLKQETVVIKPVCSWKTWRLSVLYACLCLAGFCLSVCHGMSLKSHWGVFKLYIVLIFSNIF